MHKSTIGFAISLHPTAKVDAVDAPYLGLLD
jgi:hypothetical protein